MNIGILICIAGIVIFFIVKGITDNIHEKRNIHDSLIREWGKLPDSENDSVKFDSIKKYYRYIEAPSDVDDITWNDLDGDELYKMINNTASSPGEEVLFSILRKPLYDRSELEKRNNICAYFTDHHDERINIQSYLKRIKKDRKISFFEHFNKLDGIVKQSNLIHYIIILLWIISIIGLIFNYMPSVLLMVFDLAFSIYSYYRRKAEIDPYYYIFSSVIRMLRNSKKLTVNKIPVIQENLDELHNDIRMFNKFKRYSGIVINPNGGNILDIILDYIKMLLHIDLIKFNNMQKYITDNKAVILRIYKNIGYIDSMIAIASFRVYLSKNGWCVPEFTDDKKVLDFTDAYHPYLSEPVVNSCYPENRCMLITGSNASGKSTFLKTIALNAIMAQTISTVSAKKYKTSFYKIMTSMALSDNIFNSQSYFIVELSSLKRLFDSIDDITILCCIDEVLRGTNTIERIAASAQILKALAADNILCFAATHDIELASILSGYYTNYHFQESITGDSVEFDYKLYNGSSNTKNAIKLLGMMGFDKTITDEAAAEAERFENEGSWKVLSGN